MKITHRDWIHWYALMTPNIISTTMDYPAKDVADLVRIMKEKPGQVAVASAGVGSSGHLALEVFKSATGAAPGMCPTQAGTRQSSPPSRARATVVMQLSMEEADMIRAKKLKPLANSSNRTLMISGYGEFRPLPSGSRTSPRSGLTSGSWWPRHAPRRGGGDQQGLRRPRRSPRP